VEIHALRSPGVGRLFAPGGDAIPWDVLSEEKMILVIIICCGNIFFPAGA